MTLFAKNVSEDIISTKAYAFRSVIINLSTLISRDVLTIVQLVTKFKISEPRLNFVRRIAIYHI